MKSDYKETKLYDVIPKEEIAEFEGVMRKTIANIVSEASGVACWVYVQKYVKHKLWMRCCKNGQEQAGSSLLWTLGLKD